jgi:hypothetical protein
MNAKKQVDRYFEVGASGLRCTLDAAEAAGLREVNALLDLPSGHGRVQRFLRGVSRRADRRVRPRPGRCRLLRDGVRSRAGRL